MLGGSGFIPCGVSSNRLGLLAPTLIASNNSSSSRIKPTVMEESMG